MFELADEFDNKLNNWNVSSVTSMEKMFSQAANLNQDISLWEVSSVTSMGGMFEGASIFNQDLCSWAGKSPSLNETENMFNLTVCPNQIEPVLSGGIPSNPHPGPFCYSC